MSTLVSFFRKNEVTLNEEDFDNFSPMTELEQFASATRNIVAGLDDKISDLESEINMKIARLGDLRTIRSAQHIALRHMEGDS